MPVPWPPAIAAAGPGGGVYYAYIKMSMRMGSRIFPLLLDPVKERDMGGPSVSGEDEAMQVVWYVHAIQQYLQLSPLSCTFMSP